MSKRRRRCLPKCLWNTSCIGRTCLQQQPALQTKIFVLQTKIFRQPIQKCCRETERELIFFILKNKLEWNLKELLKDFLIKKSRPYSDHKKNYCKVFYSMKIRNRFFPQKSLLCFSSSFTIWLEKVFIKSW